MNYLKRGFIETFKAIKNNKLLFSGLILLQIIIILLSSIIMIQYQIKILENVQGIMQPLEDANYDAESIKSGEPFTKDMITIYKSYQSMISNLLHLLLLLGLIFIFLNSTIWILSHEIVKPNRVSFIKWRGQDLKNKFKQWLKYLVSTFIIAGPLLIIIYFILKGLLSVEVEVDFFAQVFKFALYVLGIIYYLIIVSLTMMTVPKWKNFLRAFFIVGIKRIYLTLPIFLILDLVLIPLNVYWIYLTTTTESFGYMLLSTFCLIIMIVIARLFWINSLKEIVKKEIKKE